MSAGRCDCPQCRHTLTLEFWRIVAPLVEEGFGADTDAAAVGAAVVERCASYSMRPAATTAEAFEAWLNRIIDRARGQEEGRS